jgi:predicted transcriptional regulator of viral defense system
MPGTILGAIATTLPPRARLSVARHIIGAMTASELPSKGRLAGIVTTAELVAAGRSKGQIQTLVRQGTLMPVIRGVYARASQARKVQALPAGAYLIRAAAALAATKPGAVVSHQSAAKLHELEQLDEPAKDVTLTGRPDGGRRGKNGIRMYSTALRTRYVTAVYGVRVTTVARTVIDVARTSPFVAGVVIADSALRARKTSKKELRRVLAECRQRYGSARAARVVQFADARSESVLESIARVVFAEGGLPPPDLQVWLGGDEVIGRADFYWRKFKTVAEVDGGLKYADPARAKAQLRRDKQLREAGFEVLHFDWNEITTTPEQAVDSIRAAFDRATRAAESPSPAA